MADNSQPLEAANHAEKLRQVSQTEKPTNDHLQGAGKAPTDSDSTMVEEKQSSSCEKLGAAEAVTRSQPETKPSTSSPEGQTKTKTQMRTLVLLLGICLAVLLVALVLRSLYLSLFPSHILPYAVLSGPILSHIYPHTQSAKPTNTNISFSGQHHLVNRHPANR